MIFALVSFETTEILSTPQIRRIYYELTFLYMKSIEQTKYLNMAANYKIHDKENATKYKR